MCDEKSENITLEKREELIDFIEQRLSHWISHSGSHRFKNNIGEGLLQIQESKLPRTVIEPIDMLTYKEVLVERFNKDFDKNLKFTKDELIKNRVTNSEYPEGIKITKYLNKLAKANNIQYLDFFHKRRIENDEYILDSSPLAFLKMYDRIQTCVSSGGENQHNIFYFLASPYTYIAYNSRKTSRMVLFISQEYKVAFSGHVFGEYDDTLPMTIINYLKKQGYYFIENFNSMFSHYYEFYTDNIVCGHKELIKILGCGIDLKKAFPLYLNLNLLKRPETLKIKGDVFLNEREVVKNLYESQIEEFYKKNTTYGKFDNNVYCEYCDNYVHEDDYDFQIEACDYCADSMVECSICHHSIDERWEKIEYHEDSAYCQSCYEDAIEVCSVCSDTGINWYYIEGEPYCNDCNEEYKQSLLNEEIEEQNEQLELYLEER